MALVGVRLEAAVPQRGLIRPAALVSHPWLAERGGRPQGFIGGALAEGLHIVHVLALGGALLVLSVGLDLLLSPEGGVVGAARFLHLFTYKYERAWPRDVDFTFTLAVFTLACGSLGLAFELARWRRQLVAAQALVAVAFAAWLGQAYLPGGAALRSAARHRGVLPRSKLPHRAADRLPIELERRKLLHRQSSGDLREEWEADAQLPARAPCVGRERVSCSKPAAYLGCAASSGLSET